MDPSQYAEYRPLMFSIAYRMTGSIGDAEDIVQEAFIRAGRAGRAGRDGGDGRDAQVGSPKAFLATITTRLAIDHLRSARVRRESYVGTWLPEPLIATAQADPAELAALFLAAADGGDMTRLLERLAPDVVFYGDSGGKGETTYIAPVYGREQVAEVIRLQVGRTLQLGASLRATWVNGQPGVLACDADGDLIAVIAFDVPGASASMLDVVRKRRMPRQHRRRRPGAGRADDRSPRGCQRQGQARARLGAQVSELAGRLPRLGEG